MQLINGVGGYEDTEEIYDSWQSHDYAKNTIFVHAHRNSFGYDINPRPGIFNLCDEVEYGADWRVLQIFKNGETKTILIPNPVHAEKTFRKEHTSQFVYTRGDNEILIGLNSQKNVTKKFLRNGIISYNFSRDVFRKKEWDDITCKARGLFIDYLSEKVVCRSYDKFFNWGERPETTEEALRQNLKFPCNAYEKYNGFLALLSYDAKNDDIMVCSKTSTSSYHVDIIKSAIKTLDLNIPLIKKYCKDTDSTLVFECCDSIKDPHIIKYDKPHMYLLDIIRNQFNTVRTTDYDLLKETARVLGVECKEQVATFNSFDEILEYMKNTIETLDYDKEGIVIEDASGFMVKLKSTYYRMWKFLRESMTYLQGLRTINEYLTIKEFNIKDHTDPRAKDIAQRVSEFMVELAKEGKLKTMESILDVQDLFYGKK